MGRLQVTAGSRSPGTEEFMPPASSSCMKPKTAWKETPECTSSEVSLLKSFVGVEASVAPQQAGLFSSREPAQ